MGRRPEGKAENLFKNLGKRIDELLKEIKDAGEKAKNSERFEELKRNGETLKKDFENFKDNNKGMIDDLEKGIDRVGKDLKEAFDKAFKTKKED
ncbi:hypothetical protein [Fulvivirga lutimaris]|uniref:hypothetical protein n=1 Tax=Fulvivirga lutimaris TaxID=1819566 RepID=UPI0012BBEC69|nr:hypothetical protein [Fulvivirga lutimaris]MTI41891.1 hypothetical protein [Fulvivirga lutimaris]